MASLHGPVVRPAARYDDNAHGCAHNPSWMLTHTRERISFIDNALVLQGVGKVGENRALLGFMMMLFTGTCGRSGTCGCNRPKASGREKYTNWLYAGAPLLSVPEFAGYAELFVKYVDPDHHGALAGAKDAAERARRFSRMLAKACSGCSCRRDTCDSTCGGMFGKPVPNPCAPPAPLSCADRRSGRRFFCRVPKNLKLKKTAQGLGWITRGGSKQRLAERDSGGEPVSVRQGIRQAALAQGKPGRQQAKNIFSSLNFSQYLQEDYTEKSSDREKLLCCRAGHDLTLAWRCQR